MREEAEYGEPLCMECGEYCKTYEIHNWMKDDEEMWCWCDKCQIDTFHQPINWKKLKD